jgi:hypothetical protein
LRGEEMHRVLLAALAILFAGGSADAAPRHKPHKRAAPAAEIPAPRAPQFRPAWAGPNQCFTDEGYGRYSPCDAGMAGGM